MSRNFEIGEKTHQKDVETFWERATKLAHKRAPYTIRGIGIGTIIGALVLGPPGALIGANVGGIVGYNLDKNKK